jgi:hypothetical protein
MFIRDRDGATTCEGKARNPWLPERKLIAVVSKTARYRTLATALSLRKKNELSSLSLLRFSSKRDLRAIVKVRKGDPQRPCQAEEKKGAFAMPDGSGPEDYTS